MIITEVKVDIDNLIKPCRNFLSYFSSKRGWKKNIFDITKDIYIDSYIINQQINIQIRKSGQICIKGKCVFDILIAMEYLEKELIYAGFKILPDFSCKCNFVGKMMLNGYDFNDELYSEIGRINLNKDVANLHFKNYTDGKVLQKVVNDTFEEIEELFQEETSNYDMMFLFSICGLVCLYFIF